MKTNRFFILTAIICIASLFSVDLAYGHYPVSPYAFCNNNPVNYVDPDGRDYYQSTSGSVLWQDDNARRITINDEKYKNIGASHSMQMVDGSFANYYQGQFISTSSEAANARQTIIENPGLAGALLSTDSPLSNLSQQGLMTDMIHLAQGNFIGGAADFGGSVFEVGGNGLAAAGYVVSATGVGAGIGVAMSGLGNGMARIGTGVRVLANVNEGNYGQAVVSIAGYGLGAGTGKLAKYGSMGRESIVGGVNLFFTPMNTMVGNIKYRRR